MADAHCVLDRDWKVLTLNSAAGRLTGRARADVLGMPHGDAFPELYRATNEAAYRHIVEHGGEQHLQQPYVQDGRQASLEIDAFAIDEGGVLF